MGGDGSGWKVGGGWGRMCGQGTRVGVCEGCLRKGKSGWGRKRAPVWWGRGGGSTGEGARGRVVAGRVKLSFPMCIKRRVPSHPPSYTISTKKNVGGGGKEGMVGAVVWGDVGGA